MSAERIAIIGMGLRYPDAGSPDQLWENVLQGRRAFRRLPDERMNHADYYSPDQEAPDRFYAAKAAVLRDIRVRRLCHRDVRRHGDLSVDPLARAGGGGFGRVEAIRRLLVGE